jgi:tetratricopeptide (TPR) repeat protein
VARAPTDLTVADTPRATGVDADRPAGLPPRYRLAEVIGTGGMGRVFRAHDSVFGRDVAIKVIEMGPVGPDATQRRERFVREARAAARLAHPNIVAVHDVDADFGWLVMDLVDGEPLKELVARGPSPPALVRSIAAQVLAALDAAHAAGVIHRDIKPSNIMLDRAGKATLVDFGVARLVDAELTRTGETVGTPAYMSPEQLRGARVDERTDLYGLAATLYELVSGERMVAFESPSQGTIARMLAACAGEPGLAYVIERCLQADPAERLTSARDALAALSRRRRARSRWLVPALIAVAMVAIGAGVVAWRHRAGATEDRRKAEIFAFAQRGENEKASLLVDEYLAVHPADPDALTIKVLSEWWRDGVLDVPRVLALVPRLRPLQRMMVHALVLLTQQRELQAIGFLETSAREHPDSVEIAYALGEALWHAGYLERGAAMLERAFDLDPGWQMALHHVLELRLSRGETAALGPIADRLRVVDPPRGAALDCEIAIGARRYAAAAESATAALARVEPIASLHVCLLQAQILAGDLDAAESVAEQANERWPIDLREWGGFATQNELVLYRGRFAEYLEKVRGKGSRQRDFVLMMWGPPAVPEPELPPPADAPIPRTGMRAPPLGTAMDILREHLRGHDPVTLYAADPQLEVRAYGKALAAELRGASAEAIDEYRRALAVPSKGDIRMLVAHRLARLLRAAGDTAGAATACEEVVSPRMYQGYRAVLLPDCALWSEDRARWLEIDRAWKGSFPHPAIVEIRRRLAEAPSTGPAP